jgi:ferredoxin
MAKFQVNKEKCISCGVCISVCPKGAEWDKDGKSHIIDSSAMEECGGETVCPYGAIEEVEE